MSDDFDHTWTEGELDSALAEFTAGVGTDEPVLARVRAALVACADQQGDRHGARTRRRSRRACSRGTRPSRVGPDHGGRGGPAGGCWPRWAWWWRTR
ncbi:hypothetical protein [Actinokineospora pegani]|uniref:hypothetical protein n=1 Tax=Actinokineospora pegani TaxID=2654637 RepID=UPI0012EAC8AB|nr:hypothetical protein [Actinokineospora pegani]